MADTEQHVHPAQLVAALDEDQGHQCDRDRKEHAGKAEQPPPEYDRKDHDDRRDLEPA